MENGLIGELEQGNLQHSISSLPNEMWDVLIVGAGPAGGIAAVVIHEALESGDFGRLRLFDIRLEQELKPRYVGYQIAQKWLSKVWLNDFVARRARKSKFLRDALSGISTETVDPRTIFSLRGIIKSFWK